VSVAVVTGAGGLIGSQAARHFAALGMQVVGIDNDMRRFFFGLDGSVQPNLDRLAADLGGDYMHVPMDIRDRAGAGALLRRYGRDVSLVVHAAAQPAHDYADEHPLTDWDINAGGTLNLLDATRRHAPGAVFVYLSTIKVYGPHPNLVAMDELETRYEPANPARGCLGPAGTAQRVDEHRRRPALAVRCEQDRSRPDGPGVRPRLRAAHRHCAPRMPDRPCPCRD
jgi:CDP-paratose 2-epimerase